MGMACILQGGRRGMYVGFWWEGKRPQRRPRCRWEYNMKINLEEQT
jgi:hypothetical protein